MVLNFSSNLFGSRDTALGQGLKFATVTVALDGSGDTDSIQDAIELLPKQGGAVLIKDGTYKQLSTIIINKDNVTLKGVGKSTIISSTHLGSIITTDGNDHITIQDLKIAGANIGVVNHGIVCTGSLNITIINAWIKECGGNGISNAAGGGRCLITGCLIERNLLSGILMHGSDHIIDSNTIRQNTQYGILFDGDNSVIKGNYINQNDYSNTDSFDGIGIAAGSDFNIISNNRCEDNDRFEINISDASCDGNTIIGNICEGNHSSGAINDSGSDTLPNGARGTNNLELDDLHVLS